jgi:RNA polymerase sigma factor (sigma-70 family)
MTQTITNYTTYDQAYYYADLKRLPRLSEEQRRHLVTSLPTADNPHLTAQIKQQLIESYLPLAKYFAIALCPKSLSHRDLPDLIGEANLTVVEVITRADLTQIDDLTSYLAACVRGELKGATSNDSLIKINHGVWARARERGDAAQLDALDHLLSLDEQMAWFDSDNTEEPSATPITSTEAAPARAPVLRAQVETWLSYLSPRAQAIFRLRYGLSDDNERRHPTQEIACLLGIDRRVVLTTERDALLPKQQEPAWVTPSCSCACIAARRPKRPGRANARGSLRKSGRDWKRRGCGSRVRGWQRKQASRRRPR